jgi:hypothetical protein
MKRDASAALSMTGPVTDDAATAFPASPDTPGQAESRAAWELLRSNERVLKADWWDDYHRLRAEGWDWRKAVFIAWAASPVKDRWPRTQEELCHQCLGLRTDQTIRKWRQHEPGIEQRIVKLQAEPLMLHRRDVINALVTVASEAIPQAHPDRKLFLEMTGDYLPRSQQQVDVDGEIGLLSVEEWREEQARRRAEIEETMAAFGDASAASA